jgi:monothiol glutaredoxin
MSEKVYSQIASRASLGQIAVFFAGSNPLNAAFRLLKVWLEEHRIEFVQIDLEQDRELACLYSAEPDATKLPILCLDGRVVATGSLIQALVETGRLQRLLDRRDDAHTPVIAVTDQALTFWRAALRSSSDVIRLSISERFEHSICVDAAQPEDLNLTIGDVLVVLDQQSAARANGLAIDWVTTENVSGFRVANPNQAPRVREIHCECLASILAEPTLPLLIDVRTNEEYQEERLPKARLLDAELIDALTLLQLSTPLLFYCDNGRRSRRAAQHYVDLGFCDVTTLANGINAWKIHLAKSPSIG